MNNCPLTQKPCPIDNCAGFADIDICHHVAGLVNNKKNNSADPSVESRENLIDRPIPAVGDKLLVVARYNENVSWVNDSPIPAIVYNKGSAIDYLKETIGVRHLANQGREAGTYLQFICDNYNRLPAWTFFVQGTFHNSSQEDFFGRLKVDYNDSTSLSAEYSPIFPDDSVKALDIQEWHSGFSVRFGLVNPIDPAYCNAARLPTKNLWNTFFNCPMPDPFIFGYGAQWGVPRQRILDRPLKFWQAILSEVVKTDSQMAGDLYSAWSFETIWKYLFSDANQFPVKMPVKPKQVSPAFKGMTLPKKPCCGRS